jgi:Zn-dependent protease with chaperone function
MAKIVAGESQQPIWGAAVAIEDRYRPMIARMEKLAAEKPAQYRSRVVLASFMGYAYIALMLALILAVLAGGVVLAFFIHVGGLLLKPLLVLVFGAFYVVRSLFVKIPEPDGIKVTKKQAPELFAMIAAVRKACKGPSVDTVYVTGDFNASIVQRPRFGFIAGHRNILSLGLPLMQALSAEEIKAVVAHEYGHLAGAHGKMSAWVYRVRMTWVQLSQSLGQGFMSHFFQGFFRWYGPWFSAFSFVLARGNEYEADRVSAAVAGADTAARALTRVAVEAWRYNRFWGGLFEREGAQERVRPHTVMAAFVSQPLPEHEIRGVLSTALAEETDIHDTHPCLRDRLKSLGQDVPSLEPVATRGAAGLLGEPLATNLADALDKTWWSRVGGAWSARRAEAGAERSKLAELESAVAQRPLSEDEQWTYLSLLEAYGEPGRALAFARTLRDAAPGDLSSRAAVARLMLEGGDAEGLVLVEAMRAEPIDLRSRLFITSYGLTYLEKQGEADPRLDAWREEMREMAQRYSAIQAELNEIGQSCQLEPAELDDEVISALRNRAAHAPELRAVWVARRRLEADAGVTQLIVLFDALKAPADGFSSDVLEILRAHDNAFVVRLADGTHWLKPRMEKISGARILKR